MPDHSLEKEAELFGRYFIRGPVSQNVISLYCRFIQPDQVSAADVKLFSFISRHPSFTGLIDSALAFLNPGSEVRRRLYIMFAILESHPDYCRYFLPVNRNPFYIFVIAWVGARAVFKTLAGIIVVKFIV